MEDLMQRPDPIRLIGATWPVIGMVHLQPLPGAPGHVSMHHVTDGALRDAAALAEGGVDAVLVENYGDFPFFPDGVPPETVAAFARVLTQLRRATDLPVGVNVLRNDARAALGLAAACDATFIRVNVHTGAMLTDQGWIPGRAHETLRSRNLLCAGTAILADVFVKHAVPPAGLDIGAAAKDTWERGRADGLIVSGSATGAAADPAALRAVRAAAPAAPLFIGSGLSELNAAELCLLADGAIVGSAFQHGGSAGAGVDVTRVRTLLRELESRRR
jgi:uncharacterized protein